MSFLAIALAGCGPGRRRDGGGSTVTDAGTVVVFDSSSGGSDGGTDPGTLGSGVPDEEASDCGCDDPASDDASDDVGDGTSSGGDADSGGLGDGAGDGASGSDLRGLAAQGHWLTAGAPGSSDAVSARCIHGIVEDDTGTPIPGATVTVALGGAGTEPATTTGRAGHFCLRRALARTATVAVAVTAPDGGQVQQRIEAATQPLDVHGCVPVRAVLPRSR